MLTYSFLDVQASLIGPGGSLSLGNTAAVADEGLTIAMVEDKNTMTIGASGKGMHSLHAGKAGTISVRLLKTDPMNHNLAAMYALQTSSPSLHGSNIFTVKNGLGDEITCRGVAFKKFPDQANAKEGGMNEWTFDAIEVDTSLAGLLVSLI